MEKTDPARAHKAAIGSGSFRPTASVGMTSGPESILLDRTVEAQCDPNELNGRRLENPEGSPI